jgi:hypothetical protein
LRKTENWQKLQKILIITAEVQADPDGEAGASGIEDD